MEKNCLSFAHCTLRQLQDPEPGEQYSRFKGQLCTLFGIAIASRFLSVVLISVIIKCFKRKDLFPNFIYICNILEIRFWVYLAKQRMHWSQEVCAQFTGSVNTLPELPQLSVHTRKYIEVWSPKPPPPPPQWIKIVLKSHKCCKTYIMGVSQVAYLVSSVLTAEKCTSSSHLGIRPWMRDTVWTWYTMEILIKWWEGRISTHDISRWHTRSLVCCLM